MTTALDLYVSCRRQVAKMAHDFEIDLDDARQHFMVGALVALKDYDPNHRSGASLKTFALDKLKRALQKERAQSRFGVEVDAERDDDDTRVSPAAIFFELEQFVPAEPAELPIWRTGGDGEILARIGILPPLMRGQAHELLRDLLSTSQAAEAEGVTDRAVRYRIAKAVQALREGAGLAQPDLFGEGELV